MLAFLAQSCYNAITGSVWSSSPRWLTISHRPTILACFGTATTRMCEDLSYKGADMYFKYSKDAIEYAEKFYKSYSLRFDQKKKMIFVVGVLK